MNKQKNIPELRFPEFVNDGEWEEETVGQIYDFKGTNSLSRENLNYEIGKVKNIHYGDIHTKFNTLFDVEKENVPYINGDIPLDKIKKENYCIEGDIILADASEDLNDVGKSIEIVNLNNEKLVSGLHTLLARQRESKLVIGFGGYLFKSDYARKQIKREAQGAKVLGVSATRISSVKIPYPKNPKEQQKIASCLSSLDELIAAHSQKLDILKDHKKGLMQNLFPQEGETVPKVRFHGFEKDGNWEEEKLGDIAENLDSKRVPITSNQREKGYIPYYGASGIIDYVKDYIFDEKLLCISEDGANLVDRNYPIAFSISGKTWVNNHAHVLRFASYHTQVLVENYINCTNIQDFLTGMAQPKLNRGKLDILPIPLPKNPNEQKKIAGCLSSLDALITAQADKIDQLKLYKKGLMQGLFPKAID